MSGTPTLQPTSLLHYDPVRVDYTLSDGELQTLVNCASHNSKDFGLVCIGVALPCLINGATYAVTSPFPLIAFNINMVFGLVCGILGSYFIVHWRRTAVNVTSVLDKIRAKPQVALPVTSVVPFNRSGA